MNKNMRVSTTARHVYTQAYADYLRSGNLDEATRQVAHQIYLNRAGRPGTQQGVVGTYLSITQSSYGADAAPDLADSFFALTSRDKDYAASRIAYKLDLTGPTMMVLSASSVYAYVRWDGDSYYFVKRQAVFLLVLGDHLGLDLAGARDHVRQGLRVARQQRREDRIERQAAEARMGQLRSEEHTSELQSH